MNFLSETEPKIYSLLSIGQRGAGKTVFLLGSYTQLHPNNQKGERKRFWIDFEDSEAQENIENILSYIAKTGHYPPTTMKITNFDFSLKHRSRWGSKTLCHFRWWDTPGESCQLYNPAFLTMALNADGCCLFIDANTLSKKSDQTMIGPLKAIAEVLYVNGLKSPLALILTKCDLLKAALNGRNLEECLQPLTSQLDTLQVNYQIFYSEIPLVSSNGIFTLKTTQAAAPILWLVSQIRNAQVQKGSPSYFLKIKLSEGLSH